MTMTMASEQRGKGQVHPEDDDVLSSIRAVKEMVEKEFSISEHNRSQQQELATTDNKNENSNKNGNANENYDALYYHDSWKNQCYRLKQELYELKNNPQQEQQEQNLIQNQQQQKDENDEMKVLEKHFKENQFELQLERDMKVTLEKTVEALNNHSIQLTTQLNDSKTNQKMIQSKMKELLVAVEEEKKAIEKERTTYEKLLEESKQKITTTNTRLDSTEIQTVRLESEVTALRKKNQEQKDIIVIQTKVKTKLSNDYTNNIKRMTTEFNDALVVAAKKTATSASTSASASATDIVLSTGKGGGGNGSGLYTSSSEIKMVQSLKEELKTTKEFNEAWSAVQKNSMQQQQQAYKELQRLYDIEKGKGNKLTLQVQDLLQQQQHQQNVAAARLQQQQQQNVIAAAATAATIPITTATTAGTHAPTTTSLQKKLCVLESSLVKESSMIESLEKQIRVQGKARPALVKRLQSQLQKKKCDFRTKSLQVAGDMVNIQLKRLVEIQRQTVGSGPNSGMNIEDEWNTVMDKLSVTRSKIVALRKEEEEDQKEDDESTVTATATATATIDADADGNTTTASTTSKSSSGVVDKNDSNKHVTVNKPLKKRKSTTTTAASAVPFGTTKTTTTKKNAIVATTTSNSSSSPTPSAFQRRQRTTRSGGKDGKGCEMNQTPTQKVAAVATTTSKKMKMKTRKRTSGEKKTTIWLAAAAANDKNNDSSKNNDNDTTNKRMKKTK